MAEADGSALRDRLLEAGLLIATGVEGLYGRAAIFEDVVAAVDAAVHRAAADDRPVAVHFPPVVPRALLEHSGYLQSFPDLIGSVHGFDGGDAEHARLLARLEQGEDWTTELAPAEVVLRPAVCHPLYPMCAGELPPGGRTFEVHGWCFRHEPSPHPARMQAFRMREVVVVGDAEAAEAHRDRWADRGSELLRSFGLPVAVEPANDPFFGRAGRILAASQRQAALKVELVWPVGGRPTALASANCHQDHFGAEFGIRTPAGAVAHSACVGFGLERVALALLDTHGFEPGAWPGPVRQVLWP